MPSPLLTAALSTFESLAMLWAEPCVPSAGPPPRHAPTLAHAVRVAFTGPTTGALVLAVSDDVATALAASMLGLDADAVQADVRLRQDALGEVANVICGNVLPLVAGRAAVFHLGAPEAIAVPDGRPSDAHPASYAESLLVEQGCAELVLHLEAPLAGATRAPVPVLVPAP
jgi:CheY-specific phosphatase CheX